MSDILTGFVELGNEKTPKSKIMSAVVDRFGSGVSVGSGSAAAQSGGLRGETVRAR